MLIRTLLGTALAMVVLAACASLNHPAPQDPAIEARNRPAPSAHESHGLRVVTFNVHMQTAEAIAGALASNALARADVILLQEIESRGDEGQSRAANVAAARGLSHAYVPGYGLSGGGSHGIAILSRYPLRDLERIELPRHHVVVNSAPRVALGATITAPHGRIRIYNVHLDNRINPDDRRGQLRPVLEASSRYGALPTVLGGDMNTSPFCWVANLAPVPCGRQDDRLEALVESYGFSLPARDSGPTNKWLGMRLDALYARGLRGQDVGVEHGVRISDHLPLWVDLSVADRLPGAEVARSDSARRASAPDRRAGSGGSRRDTRDSRPGEAHAPRRSGTRGDSADFPARAYPSFRSSP